MEMFFVFVFSVWGKLKDKNNKNKFFEEKWGGAHNLAKESAVR
jgi:hypothetical protein